jgi:hypothetical protein
MQFVKPKRQLPYVVLDALRGLAAQFHAADLQSCAEESCASAEPSSFP